MNSIISALLFGDGNGGGGGGSLPSYPSSDGSYKLTYVQDSGSGDLEWQEPFYIVNVTYSNGFVADKTYQEILAAFLSGKQVFARMYMEGYYGNSLTTVYIEDTAFHFYFINGEKGYILHAYISVLDSIGVKQFSLSFTTEKIYSTGEVNAILYPNHKYAFMSQGFITDLTISLDDLDGHYNFSFYSGSTPVNLTLPEAVFMPDGFSVQANKRYEIDIDGTWGTYQEWSLS